MAEVLALVGHRAHVDGQDAHALFLALCRADAEVNDGYVSVNRVRARHDESPVQIHPSRYSSMWGVHTGDGKSMVDAESWEPCRGSRSRNDGRPFKMRRWVGADADDDALDSPVAGAA